MAGQIPTARKVPLPTTEAALAAVADTVSRGNAPVCKEEDKVKCNRKGQIGGQQLWVDKGERRRQQQAKEQEAAERKRANSGRVKAMDRSLKLLGIFD